MVASKQFKQQNT